MNGKYEQPMLEIIFFDDAILTSNKPDTSGINLPDVPFEDM